MVIPKPHSFRSDKYLDYIRSKPCLICGKDETVAHHESLNRTGIGMKAPDSHAVPLCVYCHHRCHANGISSFWGGYDVRQRIIDLLSEYLQGKEGT